MVILTDRFCQYNATGESELITPSFTPSNLSLTNCAGSYVQVNGQDYPWNLDCLTVTLPSDLPTPYDLMYFLTPQAGTMTRIPTSGHLVTVVNNPLPNSQGVLDIVFELTTDLTCIDALPMEIPTLAGTFLKLATLEVVCNQNITTLYSGLLINPVRQQYNEHLDSLTYHVQPTNSLLFQSFDVVTYEDRSNPVTLLPYWTASRLVGTILGGISLFTVMSLLWFCCCERKPSKPKKH